MGCTTMFVVALLGVALLFGGTWWAYIWAVDRFTSSGPQNVEVQAPSDQEFATATEKYDTIQAAAAGHRTVTVAFTASDLNALVARHSDFEDMRGKFRVAMANSLMTLEMSVPLREVPFPRIKHRWLNGTARFGLIFHEDAFAFSLKSLTANNRELSLNFLQGFESAFNKSFNEGFEKGRHENPRSQDFWENVKTVAVIDDQLVITTKGPAAEDEETPPEPNAEPNPAV